MPRRFTLPIQRILDGEGKPAQMKPIEILPRHGHDFLPSEYGYSNLCLRFEKINDRLFYTEDGDRWNITDFFFVSRPSKLGGGFSRFWYED